MGDTKPKVMRPHPLDPAPYSVATTQPYQERESSPLLERLAAFALPELERRLLAAEVDLKQFGSRARHHGPELLRDKQARANQLKGLVDETRALLVRDPSLRPGVPDPAQITLVSQALRAALARCGADNLAACVSANMASYLRVPPGDVRRVLESASTLEMLWQKGGKRG